MWGKGLGVGKLTAAWLCVHTLGDVAAGNCSDRNWTMDTEGHPKRGNLG